ncbi:MAG TPA: HNH endonuclease signature motif containing protein [Novosphingobium sp.]|nr:HNH endonuclease signature motif containing protein [Novosphingobium sp.]
MAWHGSSPNRLRGSAWRKLRAQVLREEPFCRWCIERGEVTHASISTICDHITPLAEGGTDERGNLAGMCQPHHDEKTSQEAARAAGRTAPRMRPRIRIGRDGWPV